MPPLSNLFRRHCGSVSRVYSDTINKVIHSEDFGGGAKMGKEIEKKKKHFNGPLAANGLLVILCFVYLCDFCE